MTKLLKEAIEAMRELPDDWQDAIACNLLIVLDGDNLY
jgi:hypothetical protein